MKNEKAIEILKRYYAFDPRAIERECSMPETTLTNVLNGNRSLPEKYFPKLLKAMKKRKMLS